MGSPGTFRWIRALGSRSATSDGSSKLPNRTEKLRLKGRSASKATHVTRRPISSHVPSMNSPPGANRDCTSRQIPATSASSYCRSTLKARTNTGLPGTGTSKPPTWKLSPGRSKRLGDPHPLWFNLDPADPHIRPHGLQPFKKFDGGGWRGAVAQVHYKGVDGGAKPPCLRSCQPAVQAAHAVGIGGAAGDVANGLAAPTPGRAHPFRFLHHGPHFISACTAPLSPLPDVTPGRARSRSARMKTMTYKLILLRHGHSEWNAKNLFTGWVDVDLNDQGRQEAVRGGELLVENNILPDVLYTSLLKRAINTANMALDKADRGWIPVKRDWRLNERHYGALQGKDKAQTLAEFGEEQFMEWRRSYDTPPPPLSDDSEFSQAHDVRYKDLGDALPRTECLKDVLVRLLPYWESDIKEDLKAGKTVLVTAHGNSLRALVKHLDGISDDAIAGLNIPTGIPLVYELDEDFQPINPGGTYLDPEAAAQAILAVANQGKK
jgi:2,3-bisphosphoglycerate-dependent phosphoglycerate mutase